MATDLLTQEIIEAQNAATGHLEDNGIGAVLVEDVAGRPAYTMRFFLDTDALHTWLAEHDRFEIAFAVSKDAAKALARHYQPVVRTFSV